MAELAEYTYDEQTAHLSESEAIERYTSLRREKPDALLVLRDLDCGHWRVQAYQTDAEKNAYFRRRLDSIFKVFWSALRIPS